jgi:aconitase A
VDVDLTTEPLAVSPETGKPVFLADLWPSAAEIWEIESGIEATRCREL